MAVTTKRFFDQTDFNVRCEWGLDGVKALRELSDLIIIVDVLSFSTCVEIATSKNAIIIPYQFKDETVESFARENNAIVAKKRGTPEQYTLSPASLLGIASGCRLVLPSPNGSTLTLAAMGKPTVAGCIRNAKAVAEFANNFSSVAVIPCGERWLDGALRPAFEDLIGAGAIISRLVGIKSPEALTAQAAFESFESQLQDQIMKCASGIELIERGNTDDVIIASSLNVSSTIPHIVDGEFRKL